MQSFFEKIEFFVIIDLLGVVVTPIGHDRKEYKKGLSGFCLTQATAPRD